MSSSSSSENKKAKNQPMLNFMDKPVTNRETVGDNPPPASIAPEDDPAADLVRCIVRAADGRKAENIVALRVSPVSTLTSFLVILSGNSRPQNQAIAAAISNDVMEEFNMRPQGNGVPEGTAESGWMLLDYGAVMVHVMTPKSRLFYNVEGQWRDKGAQEVDISDVIIPNAIDGATLGGTMDIQQEEDDPFWS
jgi:ribosome-associated protein